MYEKKKEIKRCEVTAVKVSRRERETVIDVCVSVMDRKRRTERKSMYVGERKRVRGNVISTIKFLLRMCSRMQHYSLFMRF